MVDDGVDVAMRRGCTVLRWYRPRTVDVGCNCYFDVVVYHSRFALSISPATLVEPHFTNHDVLKASMECCKKGVINIWSYQVGCIVFELYVHDFEGCSTPSMVIINVYIVSMCHGVYDIPRLWPTQITSLYSTETMIASSPVTVALLSLQCLLAEVGFRAGNTLQS